MNKRLRNTLFGGLGIGFMFLAFEILLTLPVDVIFRSIDRVIPILSFFVSWIFYFTVSLRIGTWGGRIFAHDQASQKEAIKASRISAGILGGVLIPLVAMISSTLDFFTWYAAENSTETFLPSILDESPLPLYGALIGILMGSIIAGVFGLILHKENRYRKTIQTIVITAFAFGLGGYLMALLAPLNLYLGRIQPGVWLDGNTLTLFPVRLLGVSLFGALGGAALGNAHE